MTIADFVTIGDGDPARGGAWDTSGVISRFSGNGAGFEITAASVNAAIQSAHDNLGSLGGTIDVYGGSTLTFAAAVNISKPNVNIDFHGANLRPSAAVTNAFNITARGFKAENAKVIFASLTASHDFFKFNEGSVQYSCNGGQVRNCHFQLGPTTNAQNIHAVRVIGASAVNRCAGVSVTGCTFEGYLAATQQATAYASSIPYGWTPVRMKNVTGGHIEGNSFYGQCTDGVTTSGYFGAAIFLEDCLLTTIGMNTFGDFTCHAADATKGSVIYIYSLASEGQHNTIIGNCAELTLAETIVNLNMAGSGNAGFQTVVGNNFGRAGTNDSAITVNAGSSVVIAGNNLHNCANVSPIIAKAGAKEVIVSGNDFSLLVPTQQPYVEQNESIVTFDSNSNSLRRQIL